MYTASFCYDQTYMLAVLMLSAAASILSDSLKMPLPPTSYLAPANFSF
ncbi:MAG: hypothetical protein ACOYBT_10285 [Polynucleobacter sp.]